MEDTKNAFVFTTQDDTDGLHPNIAKYLHRYASNRLKDYRKLVSAVSKGDLVQIRDYCHKVLGTARSYHLYQLEELTRLLQTLTRDEKLTEVKRLLPDYEAYLLGLKSRFEQSGGE